MLELDTSVGRGRTDKNALADVAASATPSAMLLMLNKPLQTSAQRLGALRNALFISRTRLACRAIPCLGQSLKSVGF